MTPIFPSLDSPQFTAGFQEVEQKIQSLGKLFDAEGISALETVPATDSALIARFEQVTHAFNDTLESVRVVRAYISSFVATDSRNTQAQGLSSELRNVTLPLTLLSTRYTAWLGSLNIDELIAQSPLAADHAYYLHEAKVASEHLLSPREEELVAELALSGASAWSRLYNDFTSQISVPFQRQEDKPAEPTPISVIRALATDANREVRRQAYQAELQTWETSALPLAAAMNSLKHEAAIMAKRREWGTPLDSALFGNHIDRETLEAMLSAARKSFPDFRRYLRAKAKMLSGEAQLPWFDLFAPIGTMSRAWTWETAEAFVAEKFGTYSAKMQAFAERAFREKWIDAEPRPGKRDGAFCMGVRADESRIMQNYRPAFGGVSTLAHELGHAYHNTCLAHRTPLQRGTPMTLAETASIFCETIIRHAAMAEADEREQLAILEATLQGQCQVVVDITSRFLFEERTIKARQKRELSVEELCDIMRQAQLETYGDGLDPNYLHPYMWAAKPHYYGSNFYNFPYMFGLLFGMGLYALYQQNPDEFRGQYDELLSFTGMETAASLAERFGIHIREETFWAGSLNLIRTDIDRFESFAK
jgi:pepF/M3 family oligoendopeptidase